MLKQQCRRQSIHCQAGLFPMETALSRCQQRFSVANEVVCNQIAVKEREAEWFCRDFCGTVPLLWISRDRQIPWPERGACCTGGDDERTANAKRSENLTQGMVVLHAPGGLHAFSSHRYLTPVIQSCIQHRAFLISGAARRRSQMCSNLAATFGYSAT